MCYEQRFYLMENKVIFKISQRKRRIYKIATRSLQAGQVYRFTVREANLYCLEQRV